MSETFVEHPLRTDAILNIRFFIFQNTYSIFGRYLSLKISVKSSNNLIIRYSADNNIKVRTVMARSALSHKIKPRQIICFKTKHFPI